jgi:hypothetical protein
MEVPGGTVTRCVERSSIRPPIMSRDVAASGSIRHGIAEPAVHACVAPPPVSSVLVSVRTLPVSTQAQPQQPTEPCRRARPLRNVESGISASACTCGGRAVRSP